MLTVSTAVVAAGPIGYSGTTTTTTTTVNGFLVGAEVKVKRICTDINDAAVRTNTLDPVR